MTAYKKGCLSLAITVGLVLQGFFLVGGLQCGVPLWSALSFSVIGWFPMGIPVLMYWNDEEHRYS